MTNKLYKEIASLVTARLNCIAKGNIEWMSNHTLRIQDLVKEYMPSGSGIDCGTKIDLDASKSDKLVFTFSYHHMNDAGYYDGWTDHSLIVTPSLQFDFELRITGRDRNQIKEFYETYRYALESETIRPVVAVSA